MVLCRCSDNNNFQGFRWLRGYSITQIFLMAKVCISSTYDEIMHNNNSLQIIHILEEERGFSEGIWQLDMTN